MVTSYNLAEPIPISPKFRCPPYIRVSTVLYIGTRVEKEENQLDYRT